MLLMVYLVFHIVFFPPYAPTPASRTKNAKKIYNFAMTVTPSPPLSELFPFPPPFHFQTCTFVSSTYPSGKYLGPKIFFNTFPDAVFGNSPRTTLSSVGIL